MDRTIQTRKGSGNLQPVRGPRFRLQQRRPPARESLPYFSAARHAPIATATSSLYTTYAYDALGARTTTATAVGTTTNAYDDWTTTITDPNGNIKKLTNDAYSRLATVVEKNGTTYATTTYAWNANDTLATTTDADGNVRNFTYDGRGLRLTAQDLHDTGDGTFGTWTYTYDNAGNLTSFVDPKSQTVNFTYDALNRVLTENYTGQAGTEIEYDYDVHRRSYSRCASRPRPVLSSPINTTRSGFRRRPQQRSHLRATSQAYRYDRQGNLTNVVYPDNSEVQYTYNTAGLPETVQQKESGGSFGDIVSDFDYGPHGQVTYKVFGNGVRAPTRSMRANSTDSRDIHCDKLHGRNGFWRRRRHAHGGACISD